MGKIKPVGTSGQSHLWSEVDVQLLKQQLQKAAAKNPTSKNRPMQKGDSVQMYEKNYELVKTLVGPMDITLTGDINADTNRAVREIEKRVQGAFRANIVDVLIKTDAVNRVAADLMNVNPDVRLRAFNSLSDRVLPKIQATSIEKIDVPREKKTEKLAEEALRKIEAMEQKYARQLALTGPVEVLEAVVVPSPGGPV